MIKIHFPKIDDKHNDSIWYDGLIATKGEHKLIAAGEIRIYLNDENDEYVGMYDGKARDGFPNPSNDKDLEEMYDNNSGYYMDMNNWFEILNAEGDSVADVYGNYDEALNALKEI